MVRMVGNGKRVLEVGCATGYMSSHLARLGNRVTGIDVDADAAQEARTHCEEVIVADLDVRPLAELLEGEQYDVATFGDVLEHLRDPWSVLRDTKPFLASDGFVVLSIPNIAHGNVRLALLHGSFEYAPLGLLDDTHLRFFTLHSVRDLCRRAGYRIETIERTRIPLFAETDVVPQVDEREFSRDVIDEIRRDPEHDTLQFVIQALPVRESDRTDSTLGALAESQRKFADTLERVASLQRRLEETVAELRDENLALGAALHAAEVARNAEMARLMEAAELARAREAAAAQSVAELRRSILDAG